MYFKKSENIARSAHLIGCDIDDVTKLDEYLARRNSYCFTLFDAKSNTGLGYCPELLLNEYVQEGILREPQARYLCPVHKIGLGINNAKEGKCIDCNDTHLLNDCETEMVYERLEDPEEWPPSDRTILIPPPAKRDPPLLKDRTLHIGIVLVLVSAIVGWFIGQLSCTNSATDPSNTQVPTAPQGFWTEGIQNSHLPTVDRSSTPSATIASTIVQKATITPPA